MTVGWRHTLGVARATVAGRWITTVVAAFSLALLGVGGMAGQASAALPHVHGVSASAPSAAACKAYPSTQNCDGVDPTDGGGICQQGAYVVLSAQPVYDQNYGGGVASVRNELWWSPVCHTNWARAVSLGYYGYYLVDLWRDASSYQGQSQPSGYQSYAGDLPLSVVP